MSLEHQLFEEVRRLRQKQRKQTAQRVGLLVVLPALLVGIGYWLHSRTLTLPVGQLAIPATTVFWSLLGVLLIAGLVVYGLKYKSLKLRFNSPHRLTRSPFKMSQIARLKRVKPQYWLGFTLLFIALLFQTNPAALTNPINGLVIQLLFQPKPPQVQSPWAWADQGTLHPAIAAMPPAMETSIQSVATYIAQQEPDPYLRVKALHDYVIQRISYDLDVLKTGIRPPQDAQTVFSTRKAVCEGYSRLFLALAKTIDLEAVYIRGNIRRVLAPTDVIPPLLRGLNSGYDWTLHAWNAVRIAGNWQLVDTTWDDEELPGAYRADYLMPPPNVMAVSHLPEQSAWQLLQDPKNHRTFETQPILTPQFFIEGLTLLAPMDYLTQVQQGATIAIATPPTYRNTLIAFFEKAKEDQGTLWQLSINDSSAPVKQAVPGQCQTQRNHPEKIQLSCVFPAPGDYQVFVYSLGQTIHPIGQFKFHSL